MKGRTSVKVVLDALWHADAALREQCREWTGRPAPDDVGPYAALPPVEIEGQPQDVREGTGAIRAYEEMMYGKGRDDSTIKSQWGALLRQYCELDTLSMVLIWEYWRRLGSSQPM